MVLAIQAEFNPISRVQSLGIDVLDEILSLPRIVGIAVPLKVK